MPKVDDAHFAARRRQILDAAAACFAREGFHRTTMQDIVRESKISAGLIYRYFTGKDDMIAAIAAEWHERRTAMLGDDPAAGYLDVLRRVGDPATRAELQLAVQVWAESVRSPAVRAMSRANVDRPVAAVAPLLAGASADPASLARVFIAIYQGLVLQTLWDDDLDHAAFVRAVATLLPDPAEPGPGADQE
ncbi:TetR/AcrR family transcriptional regulator [Dactylosporangium vinaceum]|uniref:TetR/AcrR family transcriptional regulator n=1 Tax=Dactylosporangium vinaceum TaxID=53362 RepID=A0ABV5MGC5_9ACTN|nr:TetR/AcrR family transcriptional regulator [Dactylosporangium vinaceum]UAB99034.1 TetR/AcrR family transcriptional regulator [Dactylosporangium vinaceum]